MKNYLFYLLVFASSIDFATFAIEVQAKTKPAQIVLANSKLSSQQVLTQFFTAKQLSPQWFTSAFLAKTNIVDIQAGRDQSVAMLTQKYGAFKSVELKEGNKYRIMFGNADQDAVIGDFRFDRVGRIDDMRLNFNNPKIGSRIPAKPASIISGSNKISPQQAVERFFTTKQLSRNFFTASFLAKGDLTQIQSGRDEAVTMLTQKFGAFKAVELIEGGKYRIMFGNADKNTVIGDFRFDRNGRIDDMEMKVNGMGGLQRPS
jgi:hypothetical protein